MKLLPLFSICLLAIACNKQSLVSTNNTVNRSATQPRAASTIQFAGITWNVKSGTSQMGPGPNYWNGSNVWLDANGWLHMKITKESAKKWSCAEVYTQQSFGNGIYQFWVDGAIDKLDRNVVLGLFNYSGNDGFDEMDIEFASWGRKNANNLNYTVWPATSGYSNYHYEKKISLSGTYTTQRFTRTSNSIQFQSLGGFYDDNTNEFASSTCTSPPNSISTLAMPVHINLWLFNGQKPTNNSEVEIVIHDFKFIPLP